MNTTTNAATTNAATTNAATTNAATEPISTEMPDPKAIEAFAGRLFATLSAAATTLMISIGHRTGLFDTLAVLPASSSGRIAAEAGLQERYVREWLAAMTTARVVVHDPARDSYQLPAEHAALLTRAAGPDNLASQLQFIPLLARVEDQLVRCFAEGGGVGYDAYTRFHQVMAEQSSQIHDAALLDRTVPLLSGMADRLTAGIRVADIGCGQGRAINLLGRAYPDSTFVGFDFSVEAIGVARREAADWGLGNVRFEVRDVADLDGSGSFGLITAFDAIHDQAHPARVLTQVADHLAGDGTFLMVDMRASSRLENNVDIPWAPFLYAVSTMHCMTVSLAQGGDGLGAAWGTETALQMLDDAGFGNVAVESLPDDFINAYYIARH